MARPPAPTAATPKAPATAKNTRVCRARSVRPTAEATLICTLALINNVSSNSTAAWREAIFAAVKGKKGLRSSISAEQSLNPGEKGESLLENQRATSKGE